jgi:hypothetical protein
MISLPVWEAFLIESQFLRRWDFDALRRPNDLPLLVLSTPESRAVPEAAGL